jgi:hypothetical protein
VTSIPAEVYRALPPVPGGQAPTGGWLLFAYLKYAEGVGAGYEEGSGFGVQGSGEKTAEGPAVRTLPTRTPSLFAESLGTTLAERHGLSSEVYWGNDGFMIVLAVHPAEQGEEAALGVLCDTTRFAGAADPVEWDIFRTGIHEGQGWKLKRVWTPHFFRDPKGVTGEIVRGAGVKMSKT